MFDYEILRLVWWILIGVLFAGFAITDGFDMGVGALVPFVGKTDVERRVMLNTIAPHWDGNQVWLITAGGALFAAWPQVYAVSFSAFFLALILTLAALWLRPLALDYRSKIENPKWRANWDKALCVSGFVPPLIFGVAFGNIYQGLPFDLNEFMMIQYHGNLFKLLNPFALLCGVVSVSMIILQGSAWLQMKTDAAVYERSRKVAQFAAIAVIVTFAGAGLWLQHIDGYVITSVIDKAGPSNPLTKDVVREAGAWFVNFEKYPLMWIAPALGFTMPVVALLASRFGKGAIAFIASSLTNGGIVFTAGLSMFPFVLPSSTNPSQSLTMWDATSSQLTLTIMTCVAAVMVPVILLYTSWTYYKMFGRINNKFVEDNSTSAY